MERLSMSHLSTRDHITQKLATTGHGRAFNNKQGSDCNVSYHVNPEMKNVKHYKLFNMNNNGLMYEHIMNKISDMLHSNKRQPQNYKILCWDMHMHYVAGLI